MSSGPVSFEKWSEDHSNRTFNFTKGRGNNTAVPKAPRREIKKQQLHKGNRGEGEGREGGEGRGGKGGCHFLQWPMSSFNKGQQKHEIVSDRLSNP